MEGVVIRVRRRIRRKRGLTKRIRGSAECPRLTVFRSNSHIYAQIIDDERGVTLCAASTKAKDIRDVIPNGGGKVAAKVVGAALAKTALDKNIACVSFDRNGYQYHGRIKALADAAREAGLKF